MVKVDEISLSYHLFVIVLIMQSTGKSNEVDIFAPTPKMQTTDWRKLNERQISRAVPCKTLSFTCQSTNNAPKSTVSTISYGQHKHVDLPRDPRDWSRTHVQHWLLHMQYHNSLPDIDLTRFQMNGKALCLITMDMFSLRVPVGGKVLYKDFWLRLYKVMAATKR